MRGKEGRPGGGFGGGSSEGWGAGAGADGAEEGRRRLTGTHKGCWRSALFPSSPPTPLPQFKPMTDKVPPRPLTDVEPSIESELGRPSSELFASLSEWPVAAASLAQVHRATTPDGRVVALKLQYPGLPEQVGADLEVMKQMSAYVKPAGKDVGWLLEGEYVAGRRVCGRGGGGGEAL